MHAGLSQRRERPMATWALPVSGGMEGRVGRPPHSRHFTFRDLSQELAGIDRPWRRLWAVCGGLGLAAATGGAALLVGSGDAGLSDPLDLAGAAFLATCAVPSALSLWAIRRHPVPPAEAWISEETVAFRTRGGPPRSFGWSDIQRPLLLVDLRPSGPVWRQNGAARHVDFLLLNAPCTARTPLPRDAADALLAAAQQNGFSVQERQGVRTRLGPVRHLWVLPPHGRERRPAAAETPPRTGSPERSPALTPQGTESV